MQKRSAILLTSLVLIAVLCVSLLPLAANNQQTATAAVGSYYAPITADGGTELLGQLHDLITDTHTTYTSYNDCKTPSIIQKTDAGNASGTVMEFYSQADIAGSWGNGKPGTWNREHVWCQSQSNGLWGESGGGSDLHHLRPVESGLNTARSNDKYGTVTNRDTHKKYYKDGAGNQVALGGYGFGAVFEPIDSVKGDVARIVLYVYVHYNNYSNSMFEGHATTNGSRSSGSFGILPIRNIVSASSDNAAFNMLVSWSQSDPVDDIERNRNEEVYKIQGNRNPFIDHPEYVSAIWGNVGEGGTTTPKYDLTLDKTSLVLKVGDTANLNATTTGGQLSWSSSDTTVAAVSAGGVLTKKVGTAIITVSNGSKSLTCTVYVIEGTPEDFSRFVNSLQNCQTMEEKFVAIKSALAVYYILSDSEKQTVASDYQTLLAAIESYNSTANNYNDDIKDALTYSLGAMAVLVVALRIALDFIGKKLG